LLYVFFNAHFCATYYLISCLNLLNKGSANPQNPKTPFVSNIDILYLNVEIINF